MTISLFRLVVQACTRTWKIQLFTRYNLDRAGFLNKKQERHQLILQVVLADSYAVRFKPQQ